VEYTDSCGVPGMMTGAILGGSSVEQAARLQMVIMFMINAATTLASIVATVLALRVVVDSEHRVRTDRLDDRKATIWRVKDRAVGSVVDGGKLVRGEVRSWLSRHSRGGRSSAGAGGALREEGAQEV